MYILVVYVPADYLDQVKRAVFAAGAGMLGDYGECSWETEGVGQFRSLEGSSPFIGSQGELSKVPEIRLEMTVREGYERAVLQSMRKAHPYEEPAYHLYKGLTINDLQM